MRKIRLICILFLTALAANVLGQEHTSILIAKMEDYEIDIQNTYNEYQKVYYEKKSSKNELIAFIDRINTGGEPLIPFERLVNITQATFAAMKSAQKNQTIAL